MSAALLKNHEPQKQSRLAAPAPPARAKPGAVAIANREEPIANNLHWARNNSVLQGGCRQLRCLGNPYGVLDVPEGLPYRMLQRLPYFAQLVLGEPVAVGTQNRSLPAGKAEGPSIGQIVQGGRARTAGCGERPQAKPVLAAVLCVHLFLPPVEFQFVTTSWTCNVLKITASMDEFDIGGEQQFGLTGVQCGYESGDDLGGAGCLLVAGHPPRVGGKEHEPRVAHVVEYRASVGLRQSRRRQP